MTLDRKLVQVIRPTLENSLAIGVIGVARSVKARGTGSITPEFYTIYPDDRASSRKVSELLFTEAELEELP